MMTSLSIRSLGLRDIATLRQLRRSYVVLNYPQVALYHPFDDVLATIPYGRRFWRAYLADMDGRARALVALQPEPLDFRWVVAGLSATDDGPAADVEVRIDLWAELLRYAARVAGLSGAKRLHVAAPEDGAVSEALHRAGFTVYGHQTLLLARGLHPEEDQEAPVREQEPSDSWSVHQLYHLATPRAIQYAEALTTNHWSPGKRNGARVRGYLIDREHDVAAHCRVISRGRRHAIDVLSQDSERAVLPCLVTQAARQAGVGANDELWAAVPDYHLEYLDAFRRLGFEVVGRQAQMVRYTAVPVRAELVKWRGRVPEAATNAAAYLVARKGGRP